LEPGPEIVIIQRHRGFSPGVLALAIVVLVVSATTKLYKARHPNVEPTIHCTGIQPDRRPHEQPIQAFGPPMTFPTEARV
jgi:hypothetical protein